MAGAAGVVMAAHMMPAKTVLLSSRSAAYNGESTLPSVMVNLTLRRTVLSFRLLV